MSDENKPPELMDDEKFGFYWGRIVTQIEGADASFATHPIIVEHRALRAYVKGLRDE